MKKVVFVPELAKANRCGASRWTRTVGADKFVMCSSAICSTLVVEVSNRLKHLWIPALIRTVSSLGKSFRIPFTVEGKAVKLLMSN